MSALTRQALGAQANRRTVASIVSEQSLRATISELITATEIAERAIGGLKATMRDGEQVLNERLQRSESVSAEFERQLQAGEQLLERLVRITGAGRTADVDPPAPDASPGGPTM